MADCFAAIAIYDAASKVPKCTDTPISRSGVLSHGRISSNITGIGTMPQEMPLKPTTIRFAEDGAEMVQEACDQVGCSFAQFVREAALIRAALVLERDSDLKKLSDRIARLARRDD